MRQFNDNRMKPLIITSHLIEAPALHRPATDWAELDALTLLDHSKAIRPTKAVVGDSCPGTELDPIRTVQFHLSQFIYP